MLPDTFANHLPVRIRFGAGVAHSLPDVIAALGGTTVLVVTDAGIGGFNPAAADVVEALVGEPALTVTVFEKPGAEPTIEVVDAAYRAVVDSGADVIVALGGGSVIDTAKAARLCAQRAMSFAEILAAPPHYPVPDRALVAVPTTAGTGSEVSGGAVVTDLAAGRKSGIANPNLRADYAIVDPLLTHTMPPTMTANTGIDAIAQAIAATIASVRTPIGDGIAFEAIRMMTPAVVAAFRNGADADARAAMACGSMMAGLAMNISDCTAEHSLGQAIGSVVHVPHGLTIGLVLAETLERERAHVPAQLERVADAMGEPDDGSGDGSRAVRAVRRLLADLDMPVLRSLGIGSSDVDRLADLALDDFFITVAPAPWSRAEVVHAFEAALSLEART